VIVVGSHWQSGPWRETPREIVVEEVLPDDVVFRFLDREQTSSCSMSAFLRTYVEMP
jgi:hypothetical protein